MTASYVHDTLRNLAQTVLALCVGQSEGTVGVIDEPGEHQLHLRRSGDEILVEVEWYDDWASLELGSHHEPRTVLTATVSLAELLRLTTDVLGDVLGTLGMQGYKDRWIEHDFTATEYGRLLTHAWSEDR